MMLRANSTVAVATLYVLIIGTLSGTALLLPDRAAAADDKDEIIVSVRKFEEDVQNVPVQVTLLDESRIDKEGINSLAQIAMLTPSMQFDTGFWPSDTRISIRGLFARAGRPSAAVLIDGIDVMSESLESAGGSALLNQRILDLERIEVARGPQSALYGRGAFSGAINYITRRPTSEWSTQVIADVTDADRYELQGIVNGPITDDLAFKLLASSHSFDGYYQNPVTGKDIGGLDSNGLGAALNWSPSENFDAYLNLTYSKDEADQPAVATIKADMLRVLRPDGTVEMRPLGSACAAAPPFPPGVPGEVCQAVVTQNPSAQESDMNISPDPRTFDVDAAVPTPTNGSNYPGTTDETFRSSLILNWDIGPVALKSSSSYTDSDQKLQMDTTQQYGLLPPPAFTGGNNTDAQYKFKYEQLYQEFQLTGNDDSKFQWLAGVNGFWEEATDHNTSSFWYRSNFPCTNGIPPFLPPGVVSCDFDVNAPFGGEVFDKTLVRDTTSYSAFGLISFPLFTDALKLTLEGRLIYDEVEIKADTSDTGALILSIGTYPGAPGFSASVDDTNFVPRASLDWLVNDTVMLYTSVAKGIKPPTYNTGDISDPALNEVAKETLWTYEIGAKTAWLNRSVILNGAIFYNDYKDQQVNVQFAPLPGTFLPRSGFANAGKVDIYGLELDATWLPDENWLFNLSYAYTNGEYDHFVLSESGSSVSSSNQVKAGNVDGDFSGNDTLGTPRNAAALLGRFEHALTSDLDWYAQATVQYQDNRWADISNLVELDAYTLVNGQIGIQQDNWYVQLYGENIFDDDTIRFAQEFIDQQAGFGANGFPVAYYAYLPPERTIGLRMMYRTK